MKNVFEMSEQEVFDTAARHLLKQGERSLYHGGCAYRGPRGMACAVGVFLDDETARRADGRGDDAIVRDVSCSASELCDRGFLPRRHKRVFRQLQKTHDTVAPATWRGRLKAIALSRALDYSVLDEVPK